MNNSYLLPMVYENYAKVRRYLSERRSRHHYWRQTARHMKLSKPALVRLEWLIFYQTKAKQDASYTCRHFGIARKTLYLWKKRFDEVNLTSLEERSRRPKRVRQMTLASYQEERVIALRKQYIRLGKEKLARIYRAVHQEAIASWKIQRIIEKYRLYYHPKRAEKHRKMLRRAVQKKRITELAIKPRTGFLFQLDSVALWSNGLKRYILTAVDRFSKTAFARVYKNHSSWAAADFLKRLAYLTEGKIENVQTDNGSEFAKDFEKACQSLKVNHYFSRVRTPKDNAVNERFNRTLREEFLALGNVTFDTVELNRRLTEWLVWYNFDRPHQTLKYLSPMCFIQEHQEVLPMYSPSTGY